MKAKVISGVSWALVGIAALIFQFEFPSVCILLTFFTVVANYEILSAVGVKNKALIIFSSVPALLIPPATQFDVFDKISIPLYMAVLLYVFILFAVMLAGYPDTRFEHVAMALVSSLVIPASLSTMLKIENLYKTIGDPYTKSICSYLLLTGLLCAWITDTMAYFFGSRFGKHKMAPKISPKKTWEGAVGGVFGTVAVNILIWLVYYLLSKKGLINPFIIPLWAVLIFTFVLSVMSELGDLSASVIKRNYGVKDFGFIMGKGNGGVMDRFDSASFTLPALYFMICVYEVIRK
ncbi:MAG: phosphatidate cytidylyltransferase [Clostridiales bacterium]|nr:phosphatidate cytidylyltransferase [Clostridiales bacterium]